MEIINTIEKFRLKIENTFFNQKFNKHFELKREYNPNYINSKSIEISFSCEKCQNNVQEFITSASLKSDMSKKFFKDIGIFEQYIDQLKLIKRTNQGNELFIYVFKDDEDLYNLANILFASCKKCNSTYLVFYCIGEIQNGRNYLVINNIVNFEVTNINQFLSDNFETRNY